VSSYSIYRGPSSKGLGEAPGVTVDHGEQFLDAPEELWKKQPDGLLDRIRPWLTLDARGQDHSQLGDKLEAWSCFSFEHATRGLRFVARLAGAGTYDRRPAYFAHGRAWPVAECRPTSDPGTLIGRSDAFSPPWREAQLPFEERPVDPEVLEWCKVLEADSEKVAATNLLAFLYQARVTRKPIVMAVPVREFVIGSALHKLVAFARAGLPWELKADSRIRVYTSMPSTFLQSLKADLIVIPEDLAGEAMRASPDAVLLDRMCQPHTGASMEGARPIEPYRRYAETVVERFQDTPARLFVPALFPFTGRVVAGVDISVDGPPPGAAITSIGNLYDLIATAGDDELADKLLRFLFRQANKNAKIEQPWETMVLAEDWARLPAAAIKEIVRSEPATGDAKALQERARKAATDRKLSVELPDGASAARILQFYADKLISESLARQRVRECDPQEIFDLLRAGSGVTERLVKLLGDMPLPENWVTELPSLGTSSEAVQRLIGAASILVLVGSAWDALLRRALARLLREGAPNEGLAEQLAQFPPPSTTDGRLLMAEIMFRGKPETAKQTIEQILKATDRDVRRAVVEKLDDPAYGCLADAKIPPDWDRDVWDLLLQLSDVRLRQIPPTRLVKRLDPDKQIPRRLIGILDEHLTGEMGRLETLLSQQRMPSETDLNLCLQTTKALISFKQWMRWRSDTKVLPGTLRSCAKAWAIATRGCEVGFENWKQAVRRDLARLDGQEIRQMNTLCGESFRWPIVHLFEQEQLDDLIAMASGVPGTLALVASTMKAEFSQVETRANLEVPPNLLRYLESGDSLPPQWSLQEVQIFLKYAQSSSARSRAATAVLKFMQTDSRAVAVAMDFRLWDAEGFLPGLFSILYHGNIAPVPADALDRIIGGLPPAPKFKVDHTHLRELSAAYVRKGYTGIGGWLNPPVGVGQLHQDAITSLITGDAKMGIWVEYASIIQHTPGADPLGDLVEQLWQLSSGQQEQLDRCGARVFLDACRKHPILLNASSRKRVPALEIAAFLQRTDNIGTIALNLLIIGALRAPDPERYWQAFLDTMQTCRRRKGLRNPDRVSDAITLIVQRRRDWGRDQWMSNELLRILKNRTAEGRRKLTV
jgi:hypothetical protein